MGIQLTVPETQTLIFVAHPGPAETLHRCVSFLNLLRPDTGRGLLQLVAPALGVFYMAEEEPDSEDATFVEEEERFIIVSTFLIPLARDFDSQHSAS